MPLYFGKMLPLSLLVEAWQISARPGAGFTIVSNQNYRMIEYPLQDSTADGPLPFSPITKVGNLLFVAGQASTDSTGAIVSDTFEGEFRRSVENLRGLLEAAGSDLNHVVQVRSYVRDAEDLPFYNQLYREYFAKPYPSRTTLTGCLEKIRFEIDCVAVVKE